MAKYKKSYYNYIYKVPNIGEYIITNFISSKIIKMNEVQKCFYDITESFDIDSDFVKSMVDSGILVDENVDEKSYIKNNIKENIYDTSEVYFTICVTMRCNLSCVYCFEGSDKENVDMEENTEDKIVDFIENKVKESKTKRLRIWWYGGEPLLRPDIISSMSKKIFEIVDKYKLEYVARVVTNGTLLDQKMCDMLDETKVTELQITLDGATSEVHDKTRLYKDGKSSFSVIIKNLYDIKTDILIYVNFIMNKNNISEYNSLKVLIDDIRNKTNNKLDIQLSRMDINEKNGKAIKDIYVDDDCEIDIEEKNEKKIFDMCSAQKYYTYVIDAKGDIFKCQNCMRNKKYIIGNVKDDDIQEKLDKSPASLEFIDNKWLHPNDECSKCIYFPLCIGGCILGYRKLMCKDDYKRYLDKRLGDMI